jgi:hypothetical protein
MYVSNTMNSGIQIFLLDRSTGFTIVSRPYLYYKFYVNDAFPTIYLAVNRVERWTKGATDGAQIDSRCFGCTGV